MPTFVRKNHHVTSRERKQLFSVQGTSLTNWRLSKWDAVDHYRRPARWAART
jgi:hypothetical protein